MLDKRKFYINGKWVSPSKPNDLEVINLYSVEKSSEETNDLENNIINYSFTQNKELVSDVVDFDTEKSFSLNVFLESSYGL